MRMWRNAVVSYLRRAQAAGLVADERPARDVADSIEAQYARWWGINVRRFQSKAHVLRYDGRYARKPPIAQHRFRHADRESVRFETKDTRTKQLVETAYRTTESLERLADHLPDSYRHNVRYFDLLAPRSKFKCYRAVFASLGQSPRPKPKRIPWAASIEKTFGTNPLKGPRGNRLVWVRRLAPKALG